MKAFRIAVAVLVMAGLPAAKAQDSGTKQLEENILAGKWTVLATNNVEGEVGHFCRAIANGVITEWRVMEREVARVRGNNATVDTFCDGLVKRNPKCAFVWFVNATRYDKTDRTKAIEMYKKAVMLDPAFAPAYYQIGTHYGLTGDNREKIAWLDKAIAADPLYSSPYIAKGTAAKEMGQLDKAVEEFKKAVEVLAKRNITTGEELGRAYYNWGWVLINRRSPDNDQGIAVLNKAIAADPFRLEAYNELGIGYKRKSQFTEAIKTYKEGIRQGDNSATIYFNLGVSEYRNGNAIAAKAAFQQAIALDGNGQMG